MDTLADRLEQARKRSVMTQAELAIRAKVALITVARIETGVIDNPRPSTIRQLAEVLDIEPAWLLFGDGGMGKAAA
jgi:transcriptional regulator with XRE-family HTH domain